MATAPELSFLTTLLPLAGVVFIIAIGVILLNQQFRKNLYRQMLEQEELKSRLQQELLRSSIEVQEVERKRIAQDLHDELGAALSIARMQLVQLEQQNSTNKNLESALLRVRVALEASLASMRRISHELMPPQLEAFGLVKTLEAIATQINSANQIKLSIIAEEGMTRWPWLVELGLYRVCMELISNTLKHAQAQHITITLTHNTQLLLEYVDNGRGLPESSQGQGLGLISMEARINSIGGTLNFSNKDTGGFYARIEIPFQA
jgi:signal transduction histidine kinase